MKSYAFGVVLALLALLPVVCAGSYVLGSREGDSAPTTDWIYGVQERFPTATKGVVVLCQGKTNSLSFSSHKKAHAGDVVIQTCRAVKGTLDAQGQYEPPA